MRPIISLAITTAVLTIGSTSYARAACDPKFGEQIRTWVKNKVAEQSYSLASADYDARTFNYFILTYDDLNKRLAKVHSQLDGIAKSIEDAETPSGDDAIKQAVERDQSSAVLLNALFDTRAEIDITKQYMVNLTTVPTREQFSLDGLDNVGRATLLGSLMDLGEAAQKSMAARFSVYIQVSTDENGNTSGIKVQRNADMVDTLVTAGAAYLPTPYAIAVVLIYQLGRLVYEDRVCQARIDRQIEIMHEGYELLPSKLISHDGQYDAFVGAYNYQINAFKQFASLVSQEQAQAEARWKNLFAYNAARSATANAVLTPAKIKQIEQEYETTGDLHNIFQNIASSRFAERVADLNSNLASGQVELLKVCGDVKGMRRVEDQQDSLEFGRASLGAFSGKADFLPLQRLIDRSVEMAQSELKEASDIRGDLRHKPCPSNSFGRATDRGSNYRGISIMHLPARPSKQWTAASSVVATASFCILMASGSGYSCDASGTGQSYGSQFDNGTGDPRQDVLGGANDGGYAADDRRVGQDIDEAITNIDKRIAETNRRVSAAQEALPAWKQQNSDVLGRITEAGKASAAAESFSASKFADDNVSLLASARQELADFVRSPQDASRMASLLKTVKATDLSLPSLRADQMPADVEALPGITGLERAFSANSSVDVRLLEREGHKLANAQGLTPTQQRVAGRALEFAKEFQKAGAPAEYVQSLIEDSASIRFGASGELDGITLTYIREDGRSYRDVTGDLDRLPAEALLSRVQSFQDANSLFASRALSLEDIIRSGAGSPEQRQSLQVAEGLTSTANKIFYAGDVVGGAEVLRVALIVLDVATALTPGVSWGRDIYESVTGTNLITGEKLTPFERTVAVLGVISAGLAGEGPKLLRALEKAADLEKAGVEAEHIVQTANRIDSMAVEWTEHATLELNDADMIAKNIGKDEVEDALDRGTRFFDTDKGTIVSYEVDVVGRERAAAGVDPSNMKLVTVYPEGRTDAELANVLSEGRQGSKRFIDLGGD